MTSAAPSTVFPEFSFSRAHGIAVPPLHSHQHMTLQNNPSVTSTVERGTDVRANGLYDRSVVGHRRKNTSGEEKNRRGDWLAAEISKMPVSEVVEITGMTETAVQNIRRRKSKINHDNLCALLEARPDFRARFFMSVGGELLVRPDQVIALERAINSVMRGED